MVKNFTCKRQTRRWPMVIFANMLDIASLNAYVLLCHNMQNYKNKRRLFLSELAFALIEPHLYSRLNTIPLHNTTKLALQLCGVMKTNDGLENKANRKRRRCYLCPAKNDNKTERFCSQCHKNVCKTHSTEIITCENCL